MPDIERTAILHVTSQSRAFGLRLSDLLETMRPLPVEPFAESPPFLLGVSLIRGTPLPVVDLGCLVSGEVTHEIGRFVTLRSGSRRLALAVESVEGIRELPASSFAALPPLMQDAALGALEAMSRLDEQLLMHIRTARLLPDSCWESLRLAEKV